MRIYALSDIVGHLTDWTKNEPDYGSDAKNRPAFHGNLDQSGSIKVLRRYELKPSIGYGGY